MQLPGWGLEKKLCLVLVWSPVATSPWLVKTKPSLTFAAGLGFTSQLTNSLTFHLMGQSSPIKRGLLDNSD